MCEGLEVDKMGACSRNCNSMTCDWNPVVSGIE